jgi:hypothetical protein
MKRFILFLIIACPIILNAQSILPDRTWHDPASASHSKWYTSNFGSTAFSFNGKIFAFNYYDEGSNKGGHTYVFTINKNYDYGAMVEYKLGSSRSNKLTFGYKNEGESMSPGYILGRPFGFQYNNRMWYFQQVHELPTWNEYQVDESFECFALFPEDTLQSCTTYYDTYNPPPDIIKLGAFQLDSNMYFIGIKQIDDDGYMNWYIQEYSFNSSNNHFIKGRDMEIAQIPTNHNMLSGIFKRIDKDENEYIIFSTFEMDGLNESKIWKLKPGVGDSGTEFTCSSFCESTQNYNSAMALVSGSIKGNRTSDANHYYTDRFTSFSIDVNKNSDGIHPIYAMEFGIDDCSGQCSPTTKKLYSNNVTIPTSTAPSPGAGSNYQMVGTYELVPTLFTQALGGVDDGYQQNVWIFYPDADKHWNAAIFTSDKWRMTNDSIVKSDDLHASGKYEGIEDLWSLIGILDGGPPCSINWDVWDDPANHTPGTEPTKLDFTIINNNESTVASTYEDQWSVGQNMEISKHMKKLTASFSEEFKYSVSYKNTISKSNTVEKKLTQPFSLMETNQDSAIYIWAVPEIIRYPYSSYPWWDTDQSNPVPYSFQYLFRITGISIYYDHVGLNTYPFNVDEPNALTMSDWTEANRPEILNAILYQYASSIMDVQWKNNEQGGTGTYTEMAGTSDSYENTTKYEISSEAGVSIPKVFKLNATGSYEVQYSTETTVNDTYGSEILCDLSTLKTNTTGPNVSFLHLYLYWFRNKVNEGGYDPDWWFWSAFGDQRPWYLAYIYSNEKATLALQSPSNRDEVSASDLYFSWKTEGGELNDYTLVIANSEAIYDGTIIYKQALGTRKSITVPDFHPEKGKTYYWAVRAISDDGLPVWSETRSFSIREEQEAAGPALKVLVYPNPAGNDDLHLAIDPVSGGNLYIQLTDLNGVAVSQRTVHCSDGLPLELSFPVIGLPAGIYLAVIRSEDEQIIKKVVVR